MTSRSKTHYQGQQLRRVHRSELDDNTMRDQARQNAKLENSLRTVDRAKNVMIKSMEADRNLFIKTGQPKTKISKPQSLQAAASRAPATPHQSRLVPDSRVRRPTDDSQQHDMTSSSSKPITNGEGQTADTTKPDKQTKSSAGAAGGTGPKVPELDYSSVYDKFLADNTGGKTKSATSGAKGKRDQ